MDSLNVFFSVGAICGWQVSTGLKYLLDTFQDLACNESRHCTVVVSGEGAGVVSMLMLGLNV